MTENFPGLNSLSCAVENIEGCRKRLKIEMPFEETLPEREKIVRDFVNKAKIAGFRVGKAPREIVEKMYKKEIEKETERHLLKHVYERAIKENALEIVNLIEVEALHYSHGEPFSLSVVVDTKPQFSLPPYTAIPVPKGDVAIKPEEINQTIESILESKASFVDVKGRTVAYGDFVVVSYSGSLENKPLLELVPTAGVMAKGENQWILIKEGVFLPGFIDQLIGMEAGQSKTFTVVFPQNWFLEPLRGKEVSYTVSLQAIKSKILPVITDELTKEISGLDKQQFMEAVEKSLKENKEAHARNIQKLKIIDYLLASVDFPLPESEVEKEAEWIFRKAVVESQEKGTPIAILEEKKEEIYEKSLIQARKKTKLHFILEEIAKKENISVTKEDLSVEINKMALRERMEPRKLLKKLSSEDINNLMNQVFFQKILDFLLEKAKIEDYE
ncbi:trigger factor [Candidatus Methylacidiphilum infernorum]|uniref:Trigger factor n=1 Tax=Methylacidiphilum infernorum (isolate V4) TaxID=481448 RepID=B3DUU2_METI4|nr:trigger factor [Candidatus Methylacidiphilum infernorum]ACD83095.1 FKBP-type peptidyl-prolyl cis-trans isomerase (trigger factor) [Methylacidiphilum infernorum V4]